MSAETNSTGRDWVRIVLVVCCLVGAVVAGFLVPGLATDSVAGSPIGELLPGEELPYVEGEGGGADMGSQDGDGLGALRPGTTTGVGGETGFDDETFASTDTEVHFRVESTEPAYWRTGSFGIYTGSSWERVEQPTSYEQPIEYGGASGSEVEYDVTLEQSATAVPTVWRPRTVSGLEGLQVTDQGAIRSPTRLNAGTNFGGVSRMPTGDVERLRTAGTEYPEEIEERYTQLPAGTPDRVEEFTTELTAEDATTYDTAITIQEWLRADKGYSLEASQEGDSLADTFIFEMEEGYCEYFATAMVAMLRSQGVPARYTVGYSTGQQVAEDTYEVRGMNAHAWVEVYFPDVGWVAFDPTPGGARLETQEEVLGSEGLGDSLELQEPGSPGEYFEPGEIRDGESPEDRLGSNDTDENGEVDPVDTVYDISVNRSVVPGARGAVTITRFGYPATGIEVSFDDQPIGRTDNNGTVTGTVPYEDELDVTGTVPRRSEIEVTFNNSGGFRFRLNASNDPTDDTDQETESGVDFVVVDSAEPARTFDVVTEAEFDLRGETVPGGNVLLHAAVEDTPVADAAVSVDGEQVATTDSAGNATIQLPDTPGVTTIGVERGAVSETTTVSLQTLSVEAEPSLPLAVPGSSVTVNATVGDRPAAGAAVFVDGEQAGVTGANGTATVRIPVTSTATIAATHTVASVGGAPPTELNAETTLSGLATDLLTVLGAALLLLGMVVIGRRVGPRTVVTALRGLPGRAARYTQLAVVLAATRRGELGDRVTAGRRRVKRVAHSHSISEVWRGIGSRARSTEPTSDTAGSPAEPDTSDLRGRPTVQEAWARFLRRVSLGQVATRTPGEIATHAIQHDGLPAEQVRLLRDTFREVEYGSRSDTDRSDHVRAAIEEIETEAAGPDGDPSADSERGD